MLEAIPLSASFTRTIKILLTGVIACAEAQIDAARAAERGWRGRRPSGQAARSGHAPFGGAGSASPESVSGRLRIIGSSHESHAADPGAVLGQGLRSHQPPEGSRRVRKAQETIGRRRRGPNVTGLGTEALQTAGKPRSEQQQRSERRAVRSRQD